MPCVEYVPFHTELPIRNISIEDLRHRAMISYVEQLRTCEETLIEKRRERGLDIEGMHASKPYQPRISRDMGVWSFLVLVEDTGGNRCWWW